MPKSIEKAIGIGEKAIGIGEKAIGIGRMGGGHTKCMSKRMSTPTGKRAAAPLNPAKSPGHTTALLVALRLDTQKKPRMNHHTGLYIFSVGSVVFDYAINANGYTEQADNPNGGHVNHAQRKPYQPTTRTRTRIAII